MPYIQKIVKAGKTIEVQKYFSSRYGRRDIERGPRKNSTPFEMEKINERRAAEYLRLLLNANFSEGDIHLVLTYKRENRPEPEKAREDLEKFLRKLRAYHKKRDQELMYIAVTEYKKRAIHHHIVMNSMDARDLLKLWPHGRPRPTFLDGSGDYAELAEYLIKETRETFRYERAAHKKRWCASRNLKKPEISKKVVPYDSWRKEPKAISGYRIVKESLCEGVHEVTGYPYQFYRMVKLE